MKKCFNILSSIGIISLLSISCTFAYTQEQREAYQWAYQYGITTQPTIEAANLNGEITRQAFAKMIVNYLEKAIGIKDSSLKLCKFSDESKIPSDLKYYAKKTCSYGILGTNGKNFNPTKPVDRAQLGTVISRILWGDEHNKTGKSYYVAHLNALNYNGIMDNISNPTKSYAKRGDVLIILKRIYDKFGSNISINGDKSAAYDNSINKSDVYKYNDTFVNLVKECRDENDALFKIFENDDSSTDSIAKALQSNINVCSVSKIKALELGDYDNDSSLKDGAVNVLTLEIDYLKTLGQTQPYRNMDRIENEDKDTYDLLIKRLNKKQNLLDEQFKELQEIQDTFAKKHGLKLEDKSSDNRNEKDIYLTNKNDSSKNYSGMNVIYTSKDGTKYYYDDKFLNMLKDTAEKKGESDLVKYLEVEIKYFDNLLDQVGAIDLDNLPETLGIDEDDMDFESMTTKQKETVIKQLKNGLNKVVSENKNRNSNYLKDLEKITKKINNDEFGLKDKYKKTKSFIDESNNFVDLYSEIMLEMIELSASSEEEMDDNKAIGVVFSLMGSAIAYQGVTEEYQNYVEKWGTNTINLLSSKSDNSNKTSTNKNNTSSNSDKVSQGTNSSWVQEVTKNWKGNIIRAEDLVSKKENKHSAFVKLEKRTLFIDEEYNYILNIGPEFVGYTMEVYYNDIDEVTEIYMRSSSNDIWFQVRVKPRNNCKYINFSYGNEYIWGANDERVFTRYSRYKNDWVELITNTKSGKTVDELEKQYNCKAQGY